MEMDLFTKSVLKFLSIISLCALVICTFVGVVLLFASGSLLIVQKEIKLQLLQFVDISSSTDLSIGILIFSCFVALAIITCIFIIIYTLRKIISNIYKQHFFVPQNLRYLKIILISITSITILNFISQLLFTQLNMDNVSNIFPNSWPSLFGNILLLSIVYMLYVVLKYGVDLQEDSNNVI